MKYPMVIGVIRALTVLGEMCGEEAAKIILDDALNGNRISNPIKDLTYKQKDMLVEAGFEVEHNGYDGWEVSWN